MEIYSSTVLRENKFSTLVATRVYVVPSRWFERSTSRNIVFSCSVSVPFPTTKFYHAVGTRDYQSGPCPPRSLPTFLFLCSLVFFIRTPRPECRWPGARLRLLWVIVLCSQAEPPRFCMVTCMLASWPAFGEKFAEQSGYGRVSRYSCSLQGYGFEKRKEFLTENRGFVRIVAVCNAAFAGSGKFVYGW